MKTLPYAALSALLVVTSGCDVESVNAFKQAGFARGSADAQQAKTTVSAAYPAPAGRVTVDLGGAEASLWPYTGERLDGVGSDPVNLVFLGEADPLAVRNALMALDGNRGAFGFPPVPPFDARWSDAVGGVQATYVDGEGWTGSVIQLQLGDYAPLRVHLRLFRVRAPLSNGTEWTVGAAHFEVLIPGTADHQVLSWELAEQIVAADLARSGLLGAAPAATGALNAAPSYRAIPAVIYNGLPAELAQLVGGPAAPVAQDVPIATDGRATVLTLAKRAPQAGPTSQRFTLTYGQVVPRPLCADGPYDYIQVQGPVTFEAQASVDAAGRYAFKSGYSGQLVAVPVDVTQNPAGAPFDAHVSEQQHGALDLRSSEVASMTQRLLPGAGGSRFEHRFLRVATDGALRSDVDMRCR